MKFLVKKSSQMHHSIPPTVGNPWVLNSTTGDAGIHGTNAAKLRSSPRKLRAVAQRSAFFVAVGGSGLRLLRQGYPWAEKHEDAWVSTCFFKVFHGFHMGFTSSQLWESIWNIYQDEGFKGWFGWGRWLRNFATVAADEWYDLVSRYVCVCACI